MHKYQRGDSLIEGLIAILIFSIGVLGVAGAQVNILAAGKQAEFRIQAANFASELISAAMADASHAGCYTAPSSGGGSANCTAFMKDWNARVAATLPFSAEKVPVVTVAGNELSATLFWRRKDETVWHNHTVRTNLNPGG